MNFNLRTFPLAGSDPKRSNQGQKGKQIEKLQIVQICSMTSEKPYLSSEPRYDPLIHEIQALKVGENGK